MPFLKSLEFSAEQRQNLKCQQPQEVDNLGGKTTMPANNLKNQQPKLSIFGCWFLWLFAVMVVKNFNIQRVLKPQKYLWLLTIFQTMKICGCRPILADNSLWLLKVVGSCFFCCAKINNFKFCLLWLLALCGCWLSVVGYIFCGCLYFVVVDHPTLLKFLRLSFLHQQKQPPKNSKKHSKCTKERKPSTLNIN